MSFKDFTNLFNKILIEKTPEIDINQTQNTEAPEENDFTGSIFDIKEKDYDTDVNTKDTQNELEEFFDLLGKLTEKNIQPKIDSNEVKAVDEIIQNIPNGGIFEIPGETFAHIKTGDGEYEELNISMETYNELFSGKPQTEKGFFGLFKNGEELKYNDFSQIYDDESSKYYFLKCFSEDENGNVTVTFNSTNYSFTFNKENDYSQFGFTDGTDTGIQMMNTAFNAMWQEDKIAELEEEIHYRNLQIDEKSQNFSAETNAQLNKIFQYANENGIEQNYIYKAIVFLKQGLKLENEPTQFHSEEINSMLVDLPLDTDNNHLLDYTQVLERKYSAENELKYLTENPIGTINMNNYYGDVHILSAIGLDINGNPITNETHDLAQRYIDYAGVPVSGEYNTNYIAAYLNNNPYGEEILNAVMQNEELNYHPSDVTTFLKEVLKEDADIDYIIKAAGLNWHPSALLNNPHITSENIDLAVLFNEVYGDEKNLNDFGGIAIASKFIDNELLENSIKNGTYTNLAEVNKYLQNTIPSYKDDGTIRSELLEKDTKLLYTSKIEGTPIEDLVVPTSTNIQEGLKNSEIGDVFEIESEDFIYIKTDNRSYEQLQISKETYMKLFPPVQRYMLSQGPVGDCYLVSSLNNMMTDPTTRHLLLECFSEDENGNVTVDLPNGNYSFTIEKDKTVTDYLEETITFNNLAAMTENQSPPEFAISNSSLGMQMLELCYGIYLKDEAINYSMNKIEHVSQVMSDTEIAAGRTIINYIDRNSKNNYCLLDIPFYDTETTANPEEQAEIIKDFEFLFFPEGNEELESLLTDYVAAGYPMSGFHLLVEAEPYFRNIEKLENDKYGSRIRGSGGNIEKVFNAFGIKCTAYNISGSEDVGDLLENPNIKIVAGGTHGSDDNVFLNKELNIAERHAYTIYPKQQENGEWLFEVINPWNEATTSILTENQINEYFSQINYIYIKKPSYKQASP